MRNIVACVIIPIVITNNNSYTMDNNDYSLFENIFKDMNDLNISSLENEIKEKNRDINKKFARIGCIYKDQINVSIKTFVDTVLKPLLNDKNIASELSSVDLQSKGYATKTYQYMININKNYEVIAKNNYFIEQLQYILIAKNELINLEQKLSNLKKESNDLKEKLYS